MRLHRQVYKTASVELVINKVVSLLGMMYMTAKSEVTSWIAGYVKPVRSGYYERESMWYRLKSMDYFDAESGLWVHRWWDGDESLIYQSLRWRGLKKPHCQKCATKMIASKALAQTYTGQADFPGDTKPVTMSPGGKGKMIDCYKCPSCGWSITK